MLGTEGFAQMSPTKVAVIRQARLHAYEACSHDDLEIPIQRRHRIRLDSSDSNSMREERPSGAGIGCTPLLLIPNFCSSLSTSARLPDTLPPPSGPLDVNTRDKIFSLLRILAVSCHKTSTPEVATVTEPQLS